MVYISIQFSSVQLLSVSNSLRPHELQHTRPPCPSPTPGVYSKASLVAQLVKNLPVMGETWDQSLGWEDPLEKGKATHASILAWRIPWTLLSMGCKMLEMTEQLSLSYLV